jgi:manganese transport protein
MFTRRRDIMGVLVNKKVTTVLAILCSAVILALNVLLLYQSFGGSVPFLG